jgi:Ca2+-binding EF-hand superfamily protein/chromosome segregation ATPase
MHFSSLDPDNTGYIGYQELTALAQSESGMDESMVPELLERLDRDKDGKVSFEDLQAIFELEREATKRQKLEGERTRLYPPGGPIPKIADLSCSSQEYDTALDTTPAEIVASPTVPAESSDIFQTPTVVLRHKRSQRQPTPSRGRGGDIGNFMLSPIPAGGTQRKSPSDPDLATQMRYLTDIPPESPLLNRRSKVLSWISESEDMFEDTGASKDHMDGLPSPPMSPVRVGGDEAAHVRSIVAGVCHTQEIGKDAVGKLCSHVEADPQEEQELLALLDHLDKEGKGHVSVDEFVQGLQSMRTSASVAATPPSFLPASRSYRHSDNHIPRLSEPFSSTPNSGKRTWSHQTATPLLPPRKTAVYGDRPQLTVLDPNNSGFVGVDTLAQQWQRMGVEPPHNQSLEEALRESLPVDASRRVSVSEVTTSLETAVLNDDKNQPTLRQAALLTYKGEINQLRNQLHQVLMERDGLKSALQRTMEESKRLVREGDEQVERITKECERIARENEQRLSERLREVEREKEEEAKRQQELIDWQREKHQREMEELKLSEERLRTELKLTQDENKRRRRLPSDEFHGGSRGDRSDRMEMEQNDGAEMWMRMEELEQGNADMLEQNKDLRERITSLQDRVDELCAENEKIRQRYTSQRRRLQRQRSEPCRLKSAPLHRSRTVDDPRASRPRSGKRPSSASRRSSTGIAPSSLELISETHVDTCGTQDSDPDSLSSPIVSPEPHGELWSHASGGSVGEGEEQELDEVQDGSPTSSSDGGFYVKSTASLMEEMQFEDVKADYERELEDIRREKQELEESCQLLEQQLQHQQDQSYSERRRELQARRCRQEELERRICILEEQKRRLSSTKEEIDTQLAYTEGSLAKQLDEIHKLRDILSSAAIDSSHLQTSFNHVQLESTDTSTETDPHVAIRRLPELEMERRESEEYPPDYQQLYEEVLSELDSSKVEMNELIAAHKEEMEKIKSAAEEEIQKHLAREDEQSKTLMRLGKDLESSQLALEQYKRDAQSLEDELQRSRQEIKIKDRELQLLQNRPHRKVLPLLPGQALDSEEIMRLREENKTLQGDINCKIAEVERMRKSENERQEFQKAQYEAQLEERRCEYQNELAKIREEGESKTTALQATMEKELHMSKMRYEIQVEHAQQELKTSQLTTAQLKDKLEMAEKQCERLLLDLSQSKETVEMQSNQIVELQELQMRLKEKLCHTQRDRSKSDSQLTKEANIEQAIRSKIGHLQSLSSQAGVMEEAVVEEVEYPVEALPLASPVVSPSRHSYQSDHSYQEEIVTQMKSQLEDLQMCLVQQSSPNKATELTLVQELLEANAVLQANLERVQTDKEKELAVLKVKDMEIQMLKGRLEEHRSELVSLKNAIFEKLEQTVKSLQQRSDASIHKSSSKLEEVSLVVMKLIDTLQTRDERHTSALETLFSELSQSQTAQESYQQEVEQLHSSLDRSCAELQHTEKQLKRTLDIKESEVSELKERLDKAHTNYHSLQAQTEDLEREQLRAKLQENDVKPPLDIGLEVEEDNERREDTRDDELKQRNMEVEALCEEARRAEQKQSEIQAMVDALHSSMQLKEEEIDNMKAQIREKEREAEELHHKLQTVVNEPVEVVMQHVERAPLESASDALFNSMHKDIQAGHRRNLQIEAQHEKEIGKLKKELAQSKSEVFDLKQHIYALQQAVQEQEAELRETMERTETERRERAMADKPNQARAQEEYSQEVNSAKSAANVLRSQLHDVCSQLVPLPQDSEEIDYSELTLRAKDEVAALMRELSEERHLRRKVEVSMGESQTEWEAQESQWQVEHEEEVRALRQRNSQLLQLLEDTRTQYQDYIEDQERENSMLLRDLTTKQASLERELELRIQELDHITPKEDDTSNEEREVLLDIIQQLCQELQKPLCI